MNKQKQRMIKEIQEDVDRLTSLLGEMEILPIGLISQAFPLGKWGVKSWGFGFEFTLPLDFALVEEFKTFMSIQFPDYELEREVQHVFDTSKEAGRFLEYRMKRKPFTKIEAAFRSGKEGSTCVLNKIGEKTMPIYEVICSEGAKETL
jgi:hypothetical protein